MEQLAEKSNSVTLVSIKGGKRKSLFPGSGKEFYMQ